MQSKTKSWDDEGDSAYTAEDLISNKAGADWLFDIEHKYDEENKKRWVTTPTDPRIYDEFKRFLIEAGAVDTGSGPALQIVCPAAGAVKA